jgi:hypothetical protein
MDVSSSASTAVASAVSAFQDNSGLAVVALRSAEREQAAILQLFSNASTVTPPASSGRGQNLDISA